MNPIRTGSLLVTTGLILNGCADAPAAPAPVPDRCGIAAAFAQDQGISGHPDVLFHEDFEHASIEELERRWNSVRNPQNLSFVEEVSDASPGRVSLRLQSVGGSDTGAHLYRTLDPSVQSLHLRYHVRYRAGDRYHHTGGTIGGYQPPTPWPQGGAGTRPDGDDRITVRFEPMPSGEMLDFYAYWMEMRGNPGDDSFWGNTFLGEARPRLRDREWISVEMMVRLNDPVSERNGELALWIDGERVAQLRPGEPIGEWVWDSFVPGDEGSPFEGFRWRSDPSMALNFAWLTHYVTGHAPGELSEVWYDDVVAATRFIGPVGGAPCAAVPDPERDR